MSREKRPPVLKIPPLPEPHNKVLAVKMRSSVMAALERAAKHYGRRKSSLVAAVIEQWLEAEKWIVKKDS
jgi:hypothetical protein